MQYMHYNGSNCGITIFFNVELQLSHQQINYKFAHHNFSPLMVINKLFFIVPCPLLCEAGYSLNATTCNCVLSNICQLSPCQNGGNCTLVSAPFNYTCDCTGTGSQGVNCSDCKYY